MGTEGFSFLKVMEKLYRTLPHGTSEPVEVTSALGRVTAEDILSRAILPPIDVVTVDGYALRAEDVTQLPAALTRAGRSRPGQAFTEILGPGETVHVIAGMPLPPGANAVVSEDMTDRDGAMVLIKDYVMEGDNISQQGIDVDQGDVLIKQGTILTARHLGLAAAVRLPWLPVVKQPRIGILTSMEDIALMEDSPTAGSLEHAITMSLSAFIHARGGIPINLGKSATLSSHPNNILMFKHHIDQALQNVDFLIAVGGIHDANNNLMWITLGKEAEFMDKVDLHIGRKESIVLGVKESVPVLGIPNEPVSAYITATLFLRPAMEYMLRVAKLPKRNFATLSRNLDIVDRRADYLYAMLERNILGELIVTPISAQDTLMVSALAKADCLIVIDKDIAGTEGSTIEIVLFNGAIASA